jgi:hypothetical protein
MSNLHSDTKNITLVLTPAERYEVEFSLKQRRIELACYIEDQTEEATFEREWLEAVDSVIAKIGGAV